MFRKTVLAALSAAALASAALIIPLSTSASAATCTPAWSGSTVYVRDQTASYGGHNYVAKWWTQNDTPGRAGVWTDQGACGGATGGTGGTGGGSGGSSGSGTCTSTTWAAGTSYVTGNVVRYTNGQYYIAEHDNPGYNPIVSTWFWDPYTCGTGPTTPTTPIDPGSTSGFVVSEAQFNQMFPNRNSFYSYRGLVAALSAYPGFATTGGATVSKQEAAAFLANVDHETGGLVHIKEINTANYPHYCDAGQPYGCPAGQAAYYGRGPIQLSWNFNYKAAGDALGIDLLRNPYLVEQDSATAWKTALWYWNTQTGPGTMTPHAAMVNQRGFGETIRSINGLNRPGFSGGSVLWFPGSSTR